MVHKGEDFNIPSKEVSNQGTGETLLSHLRDSTVAGAVDSNLFQKAEMTTINDQVARFKSGDLNYTEDYAKLRAAKEAAVYEA